MSIKNNTITNSNTHYSLETIKAHFIGNTPINDIINLESYLDDFSDLDIITLFNNGYFLQEMAHRFNQTNRDSICE